jgi:hypothetical protein
MFHLAVALSAGRLAGWTRHPVRVGLAATALVLVLTGPRTLAFLRDPLPLFHTSKTLRDYRGVTAHVASRVAALGPGESYLLVLERRQTGHTANPTVAFYLAAWGLRDRVVLRGIGHPARALERLRPACRGACRGLMGPELVTTLELADPFDLAPPARMFMGLPPRPWAGGRLGGAGLVTWGPHLPDHTPPGVQRVDLDGLAFFELAP